MLDRFRVDINKSFMAKRKCLESFTSSSLKTSQQKIEALWRSHQRERAQVCEDYGAQFSSVFLQWESDMQRSKDQDRKLTVLLMLPVELEPAEKREKSTPSKNTKLLGY
ncbi:hypothetical protein PDJAM_G00114780 [Pangasius djambal]|uniref:Uncharacterized protein n=1 Tax=Pangasius djambal TaxID=1691987 RepID=A0ACC5Z7Z3_9TELE|nr:hypothetical protein [Pangasius djambal]